MRCRSCDYPLWNLTGNTCPECGSHYAPSEFAFHPGSVKFICPSCDQQYFGTSYQGHLQPSEFKCVTCGEQVEMNSMRLQPADGWVEERTIASTSPWSNLQYGYLRRFVSTIGWAHVKPTAFMKGLPLDTKLSAAWGFFVLLQFLCVFLSAAFAGVFFLVMVVSGPGPGGPSGAAFIIGIGGWVLGWIFAFTLFALIWALLTHGTLKVTGGCAHSFGRTLSAILFSSGTLAMTAIPCLGIYCLGFVGTMWWIVSAALMVIPAQRVSGLRGSLAAIWPPCVLIVLTMSVYIFAIFGLPFAGRAMVPIAPPPVGMQNPVFTTALVNLASKLRVAQTVATTPAGDVRYWPGSIFDLDWSDPTISRDMGAVIDDGDYLMDEVRLAVTGGDPKSDEVSEGLVEFKSPFANLTEDQIDKALVILEHVSNRGSGFEELDGLVYCLPGVEVEPLSNVLGERWLLAAVVPSEAGSRSHNVIVVTTNNQLRSYALGQLSAALRWEDARREERGLPSISEAILDAIESVTSERLDLQE